MSTQQSSSIHSYEKKLMEEKNIGLYKERDQFSVFAIINFYIMVVKCVKNSENPFEEGVCNMPTWNRR